MMHYSRQGMTSIMLFTCYKFIPRERNYTLLYSDNTSFDESNVRQSPEIHDVSHRNISEELKTV